MSAETLEVNKRDGVGTTASKNLRATGHTPAVLYGHGEANVNLAIRTDKITKMVFAGSKLFKLAGDVDETAILKEVQWDTFGTEILHVDLTRVSQAEQVEITVPVELHGEAPGTKAGGILQHALHELTISCPAASIPEHIVVDISNLEGGASIHASEVALPDGMSMVTTGSDVVVQVNMPGGAKAAAAEDESEESAE